MVSVPAPPSMVSKPKPPSRKSSPLPPLRTLLASLPTIVSLPAVPIKFSMLTKVSVRVEFPGNLTTPVERLASIGPEKKA
ncbi:hypothetical protein [Nostoc sp. JL31]|uniref:hypothetical protein n=1 Tax=Nostoc sp. JL31 TaxID=2815395 RepID=UPI0025F4DC14|nr:hypothetical protein [Nostoc sp. JL31]